MDRENPTYWKRCSSCKRELSFGAKYYLCSVSTCRVKRLGIVFCSVECWSAHLGFARHREAFAEEQRAPSQAEFLKDQQEQIEKQHQEKQMSDIAENTESTGTEQGTLASSIRELPKTDTLVVVSKVKNFIREQSGLNSSQCAIEALSEKVVEACLKGIENAKNSGRKTVMGRDI